MPSHFDCSEILPIVLMLLLFGSAGFHGIASELKSPRNKDKPAKRPSDR